MTKPKESDRPGTQLLNSVKSKVKKQQKETNMKNFMNNPKVTAAKHVILTLLTLAVIGAIFYAGFVYGQKYENGINAHIETQAKVLSANAEAPKAEDSKK